jgi:hypothetical protein
MTRVARIAISRAPSPPPLIRVAEIIFRVVKRTDSMGGAASCARRPVRLNKSARSARCPPRREADRSPGAASSSEKGSRANTDSRPQGVADFIALKLPYG